MAPPAAAADTEGCGAVASEAHGVPRELLAEYLRRDASGAFTESNSWSDTALACPAHVPGWDAFTLIRSYQVDSLGTGSDSARFLVTYARLGYLEQDSLGFFVRNDPGEERDTLVLVRTTYGWRIGDTVNEPHVLPEGALRLSTLRKADRARLRVLAAGRQGP